ncbi:hypothetical protein [Aeromonas cavernicola]|nr:hypothetical protein [Aeromonas cavernicola]
MRYHFLLAVPLFLPSIVFAACAHSVNYGTFPISTGSSVCVAFSGSTMGGCVAMCGGGAGAELCVEFPSASPPIRGPYISTGQECLWEPGDGTGSGNSGGEQGGPDGTYANPNGVVNVGGIVVGRDFTTDLGRGFNAVSNNVVQSAASIKNEINKFSDKISSDRLLDNSNFMAPMLNALERTAYNTSTLLNGAGDTPLDYEVAANIKQLNEKTVFDPAFWNGKHTEITDLLWDIRRDLSHMGGGGGGGDVSGILYPMAADTKKISDSAFALENSAYTQQSILIDILDELKKGGTGGGTGGGEGNGPCTGPLCSFTPSPNNSGSGLSSIFNDESIADVKKKVTDKNTEISGVMQDIKNVFSGGDLSIAGSYNNDFHDINGANIDLSGKSNMELFFSSGPKQALWFLAVLVAFAVLMGGRKNA